MDAPAVRLLLASGIFAEPNCEEQWHGTTVRDLAADAARALAFAAGEDYDLLLPSAREDQRRSLAKFLSRLTLLQPGEHSLRLAIALWVEAQSETLSRLSADAKAIRDSPSLTRLSGRVVRIEASLSDRHNEGRTAAILTFDSGARLVYKPRPMEVEAWYSQLLAWLNESGAPVSFLSPRVLPRDGYGWMEYVPHRRCASLEELRAYYRMAGGLLCILHLLRATDCHFQNLIACGVHPVLVDAEMLFQPDLEAAEADVTRTGLIPRFRFGPGGQTYDVSALGCVSPRTTHFETPQWSENGVHFSPGTLVPEKNVPFREGEKYYPHQFVEEMVAGFTQTYRFAMERRDPFHEKIETAARLQVRYLVRETIDYYAASTGAVACLSPLQPSYSVFSALLPQEQAALRQFDVPRFSLEADSCDLHGIKSCFPRSGYELASIGLRELTDQDLRKQIAHLRLAWGLSKLARWLA
jgi:lantibiotic modifying enzyme